MLSRDLLPPPARRERLMQIQQLAAAAAQDVTAACVLAARLPGLTSFDDVSNALKSDPDRCEALLRGDPLFWELHARLMELSRHAAASLSRRPAKMNTPRRGADLAIASKLLGARDVGIDDLIERILWQDIAIPHKELPSEALRLVRDVRSRSRLARLLLAHAMLEPVRRPMIAIAWTTIAAVLAFNLLFGHGLAGLLALSGPAVGYEDIAAPPMQSPALLWVLLTAMLTVSLSLLADWYLERRYRYVLTGTKARLWQTIQHPTASLTVP